VTERCEHCGHSIGPRKPMRICTLCKRPISKREKWHFIDVMIGKVRTTQVQHRHCDNPESYYTKEEQAKVEARWKGKR
jgi:hypothetical protein